MTKWIRRFLLRALVSLDRVRSVRGSFGLPEKEPWIKRHLFQRPRYQTTNKSDVTTVDEVFLASCWWNELPLIEICKLKYLIIVYSNKSGVDCLHFAKKIYTVKNTLRSPQFQLRFAFAFSLTPLQWRFHKIYFRLDWSGLRRKDVKLTDLLFGQTNPIHLVSNLRKWLQNLM